MPSSGTLTGISSSSASGAHANLGEVARRRIWSVEPDHLGVAITTRAPAPSRPAPCLEQGIRQLEERVRSLTSELEALSLEIAESAEDWG